ASPFAICPSSVAVLRMVDGLPVLRSSTAEGGRFARPPQQYCGGWTIWKSEPRYLGCQRVTRTRAQTKIMAPQNDRMPPRFAQFINHHRDPRAGVLSLRRGFQRQFTPKTTVIDVRQLERKQPQTDASFPCAPEHLAQATIHVR